MFDRIAEIRARLDAATPGPWVHDPDMPKNVYSNDITGSRIAEVRNLTLDPHMRGRDVQTASLIANAPSDLDYMIAELERITANADKLTDENVCLDSGVGVLSDEIDSLREENARLRSALQEQSQ